MAPLRPPWDEDLDGCVRPTVEVGREGSRIVVWLHGEHDVSTVDAVSMGLEVARLMDAGEVIIDLAGTRFIDGAIMRVIARSWSTADASMRPTIRHPSDSVRRVLTAYGLAALIEPLTRIPANPA